MRRRSRKSPKSSRKSSLRCATGHPFRLRRLIHICPSLQEDLDDLGAAFANRKQQRRKPAVERCGEVRVCTDEEVNDLGEAFEVVCDAVDTHAVRLACTDAGLTVDSADIAWMPTVSVPLDDDTAVKVLKLVDALEDLDDVQNVYANFDISDEVLERVG